MCDDVVGVDIGRGALAPLLLVCTLCYINLLDRYGATPASYAVPYSSTPEY